MAYAHALGAGSLVGSANHGVRLSLYAKDPDGLEFGVFLDGARGPPDGHAGAQPEGSWPGAPSPCPRRSTSLLCSLQRLGPDSNARLFPGVPELAVESRERDFCADRLLPCQGRRELDSVIAAQREVPGEGLRA